MSGSHGFVFSRAGVMFLAIFKIFYGHKSAISCNLMGPNGSSKICIASFLRLTINIILSYMLCGLCYESVVRRLRASVDQKK